MKPSRVDTTTTTTVTPTITALRDRYTQRDCGLLAAALHDLTGWPIQVVADHDPHNHHHYGWVHAAALRPDGLLLDIDGPRQPHDLLEAYADWCDNADDADLVTVTVHTVRTGPPTPDVTQDAQRLLHQHPPTP